MTKFMRNSLLPLLFMLMVAFAITGCSNTVSDVVNESKEALGDAVKEVEDSVGEMLYDDLTITPEDAFDSFIELHPGSKIEEISLDKNLMEYHYVVEGYDANHEFEVKINPVNGKIISDDFEAIDWDDEKYEITKADLAKVTIIIEKAKKEDGNHSNLDEWKISEDDGKMVMEVEIGKVEYSYDLETESLIKKDL